MKKTQLARLLAYVSGMVNQQLLLQNEYLIAENRILRSHLPARVRLSDLQRATLAQIAQTYGTSSARRSCLHSQTGNHLGLVSQADRPEVRRFQTPPLPGTAGCRTRNHGTDRPDGSRE